MAHISVDSELARRILDILYDRKEFTRRELIDAYKIKHPRHKIFKKIADKFSRTMKKIMPRKWPSGLSVNISLLLKLFQKDGYVITKKSYREIGQRSVTVFSITEEGRKLCVPQKKK